MVEILFEAARTEPNQQPRYDTLHINNLITVSLVQYISPYRVHVCIQCGRSDKHMQHEQTDRHIKHLIHRWTHTHGIIILA